MKKAVRLMVETSLTQREIADIVGVRHETVSKYKNHKEFDELKLQYEREFLGELVAPALREYRELLKAESEMVRLNAVKDILDRTGHKPIEKVEHSGNMDVNNPFKDLTTEELRKLAKSEKNGS